MYQAHYHHIQVMLIFFLLQQYQQKEIIFHVENQLYLHTCLFPPFYVNSQRGFKEFGMLNTCLMCQEELGIATLPI